MRSKTVIAIAKRRGHTVIAAPARGRLRIAAAIKREPRREASTVSLWLPMPPSANRLWMPVGGGLASTAEYVTWRDAAAKEIMRQRPASVRGPYSLYIIAGRADTGADLDNLIKPISDALQHMRVIDNDRKAEHIELDWGEEPGVKVIVISTREREAA